MSSSLHLSLNLKIVILKTAMFIIWQMYVKSNMEFYQLGFAVTQTQASSINPFGESETNSFQVFGDNTGMSTLLSKLNKH